MEYAPDGGRDWRATLQQWLQEELQCEVVNPNLESDKFFRTHHPNVDFQRLKLEDVTSFQRIAAKLVELDSKEIAERSDFIICYWDESAMRGAGTKGELTVAKYFGKPVYLVTSIPYHDIPAWVLGCTTQLFSSFDELNVFLRREFASQ